MMKMLQKMGRGARATLALAGILLVSSAVPAIAHEEDDHGCAQYARVSCQNDGDDSYQCFEERYNACLDFYHNGGSASAAACVREDGVPA